LALSAFFWKTTPNDNGHSTMCQRNSGFYVWIACAAFLAFVVLIDFVKNRAHKPTGGAS
jgi:hypothetical protein